MIQEVFDSPGEGTEWDVNFQDGLGNTGASRLSLSAPARSVCTVGWREQGAVQMR